MQEARLGDVVASMKNGIYKPASEYTDDGMPCLRMYNIDAGTIVWRDIKRMKVTPQEYADYGLHEGDLLVNRVNSRELVGKAAVIPASLEPSVFESKNIRVRLDTSKALPKFINYQLFASGSKHFANNAQQVVGMASISQGQLSDFPIVLADIGEQREIVAELEKQFSRLDEAVASLQRVKANLKRYKASVLKAAVEGRLVVPEATLARREGRSYETGEQLLQRVLDERQRKWAGKGKYKEPIALSGDYSVQLPDGWASATVDQLGNVQLGKMLDKQKNTVGTPCLYLRNINVRWGGFDLSDIFEMNFKSDELERFSVRAGDVLVCEGGEPARAAVWRAKRADMKYQKALHRVRFDGAFLPEILVIALEHLAKSGALDELYGGSTIKHFTRENFVKLVLPVPPLAEQNRIVAEVDRHLSIIREVEAEVDANIQRAQALRQSVLQRAFTGDIAADSPAHKSQ